MSWNECKKVVDCEKLMDKGNKNRSTGATLMNADSSRSHSIFTINVEMCEKDNEGDEHYRVGKLKKHKKIFEFIAIFMKFVLYLA